MAITDYTKCSVGFRDNTGNTGKVSFIVGLDPGIGTLNDVQTVALAVQAALVGCSNAQNVSVSGAFAVLPDPSLYGAALQYNNVEDKARLQFNSISRQRYTTMQIPAPKLALFFSGGAGTGGDEETINPASAQIVALLAAMTTVTNGAQVVCGPVPDGIHNLVVGKLIRRKAHRRIGRWTKDPTGTIPA